jgi:hypothetical protein
MNTRQAYQRAARMLSGMCWATYSALLCGDPSPNQKRQTAWMRAPRLGDMVFVDAAGPTSDPAKTVGRWVRSWTYMYPDENGDDSVPFEDRCTEPVWEIELLDGSFYSWSNVGLLRVPADIGEWIDITHRRN